MRVVLLTSDSPCQRALAWRLGQAPSLDLTAIVVQEIASSLRLSWIWSALRRNPALLWDKALRRMRFQRVLAEIARQEHVRFGLNGDARPWPNVPVVRVQDINGADAVAAIRQARGECLAVSGTRMVRSPVFALEPPAGLFNLHTGISPYYRGGPNCALWCLANGEPQFIGVTVHVLDPGIDSGSIYVTAQTPVAATDGIADLVWRTVDVGHERYVAVLRAVSAGERLRPVPQSDLGRGRTYLTREWTVRELGRAVAFVRSGGLRRWVEAGRPGLADVRLVNALPGGSHGGLSHAF